MGLFDFLGGIAAQAASDYNRDKNDTRNWAEKASDKELSRTLNNSGESISKRAQASQEIQKRKTQ